MHRRRMHSFRSHRPLRHILGIRFPCFCSLCVGLGFHLLLWNDLCCSFSAWSWAERCGWNVHHNHSGTLKRRLSSLSITDLWYRSSELLLDLPLRLPSRTLLLTTKVPDSVLIPMMRLPLPVSRASKVHSGVDLPFPWLVSSVFRCLLNHTNKTLQLWFSLCCSCAMSVSLGERASRIQLIAPRSIRRDLRLTKKQMLKSRIFYWYHWIGI